MPHNAEIIVKRRRNRETGTTIALVDQGRDNIDGHRWETWCEDHGQTCSHPTKRLAISHMAYPASWCSQCADELEANEALKVREHRYYVLDRQAGREASLCNWSAINCRYWVMDRLTGTYVDELTSKRAATMAADQYNREG